jgi:hypothetical protein
VLYDNVWGGNPIEFEGEVGKPYWLDGTTKVSVRVSAPPIDTPTPTVALAAQEIYNRALANVGPRPKERRSPSIASNPGPGRTIDQLKSKTGKWVNHENEVGGFYKPAPVTRALDANTTFPDGTKPGTPPAQPQPSTRSSRAAMEAWLRKFLDQVQYD